MPDVQRIRNDAAHSGGVDPMSLRFRVLEYCSWSGELLGIPVSDLGFPEAVETTQALIARKKDSHFCLEPVGFLQ
jgi:hypothetical protein